MKTDNFKFFEEILDWELPEEYVRQIEIIQRAKDQPDPENHTSFKFIETYTVGSIDEYKSIEGSIIKRCDEYNARAYINVAPKSLRLVGYNMQRYTIDYIQNGQFDALKNVYKKALGQNYPTLNSSKFWVVDVDNDSSHTVEDIIRQLKSIEPHNKIKADYIIVDTPNGNHILTQPFNLKTFKEKGFSQIDINKQPLTILYA